MHISYHRALQPGTHQMILGLSIWEGHEVSQVPVDSVAAEDRPLDGFGRERGPVQAHDVSTLVGV